MAHPQKQIMMKLQQSAACPICREGLENGTDNDDYLENWNQWQEHLLELEEQTEPWLLWKNKEPTVTHTIHGSDKVHWLCRACVYRKNPVTGQFSVQKCPICRHVVNIPARDANNMANMDDHLDESVEESDEESDENPSSDNEDESEQDVNVFISGYRPGNLRHMPLECMLTREVSTQNAARTAGEDITNPSALMVFTRNAPYTPCGDERRNWGIQFLVHATEVLQDLNDLYRDTINIEHIPAHNWTGGSLFDHAAAAGRHILALPAYFADGSIVTPLYDFSPAGRHAVQIQGFRNELRYNIDEESSNTHNEEICACASVFFLQTIFPEFIAADQEAISIYNDGRLLELNAQYNLVPPVFTKREYVVQVLTIIDNIAQRYNQSVSPLFNQLVCVNGIFLPTTLGQGFVQTIVAPRPWVMMQIIQIREQANILVGANQDAGVIPPAHRRFWNNGIRIAYADLTLIRRPRITPPQLYERVAAFWHYLDSRDINVFSRVGLVSVSNTLFALIAAAGIEVEPPFVGRSPGPLATVIGPRNELIFEAMKYIANAN